MLSLSDNNQADIIEAFNSTSRYLDDLLNIDNPYFEQMVGQIYPTELQLNKAKSRGFLASGLSTNDFSTLYTTLPHNLIKEKLTELIEQTFNREGSLYLACNDKNAYFTSEQPKRYKLWSCQKMCDALHYLLDNIFIRFVSKLYRQIVGIPMGTNCAPLVADLLPSSKIFY